MQPIRNSIEPTAPKDTAAKRSRRLALIAAILFFGAPVAYLALAASKAAPVLAGGQQAPAPADLSALESLAASKPTPANRLSLALAYIQANRPGRAVPTLLSLLAEDKGNAVAWNDLCVADTMQKQYGSAIASCQEALRIQPGFQLAGNNLNWAQGEQRQTAVALNQQEKTAPAARDAAFYVDQGLGLLHLGENDQAIAAWQRALDLDPHSAVAANNIGTAYMLKQQPVTAVPWFEKAIAMDPSLQLAKNNLAWAHNELAKPTQ